MTQELRPGETITLTCDAHGVVAEGVTLNNLSDAEQKHREAFGCYYIIHALVVSGELPVLDKVT